MEDVNALSDTDTLNQADRLTTVNGKSFPNCLSGHCWTFYTPQASGISAWNNNGAASYHGATVTLRKALSKGVSFDFNYTLSHSIDRGGGAESGAGTYGGIMLDPYSNTAYRGSSDFDARHNINANVLYELPFGKGKMLLKNAGPVVNQIVGGWQISLIERYRSGLPSSVFYGGVYPTNFSFGAVAYPKLGAAAAITKATGTYFEQQDAFGRWMDERCILLPTASTKPGALLADFNAWAKANGEELMGNNAFAEMVDRTAGLVRKASHGVRLVKGIGFKPPPQKPDRTEGEYGEAEEWGTGDGG